MIRLFGQSFRMGFATATAYRGEILSTTIGAAIVMLLNLCLWESLYADQITIAGLSQDAMLRYVIGAWLICVFYRSRVDVQLHEAFQSGSLATLLIRPQSLQLQLYAESLGQSVCRFLFSILPIGIGVLWWTEIEWAIRILDIGILCALAISAQLLAFSLSWLVGIGGWLTQNGEGLIRLKVLAIIALGGALIPLPLYPDWLQDIALLLPFSALSHLPAQQLAQGGLDPVTLLTPLLWSGLLLVAGQWIFQRSVRLWVVQGG